jgi:hypothetical protein
MPDSTSTAPAPLTTEDYQALAGLLRSADAGQRAQGGALAQKLTSAEQQTFFDVQQQMTRVAAAGERTRPDATLGGVPPELAVVSGLGLGRAVLAPGLSLAGRAVAGARAVAEQATPVAKYELTKSALQWAGLPTPIAMGAALVVSGYRKGATAAADRGATAAGAEAAGASAAGAGGASAVGAGLSAADEAALVKQGYPPALITKIRSALENPPPPPSAGATGPIASSPLAAPLEAPVVAGPAAGAPVGPTLVKGARVEGLPPPAPPPSSVATPDPMPVAASYTATGAVPKPIAVVQEAAANKLKLSGAEMAQAMKWLREGVPPANIIERVQTSRSLASSLGLPTPDEAAAAMRARGYKS